MSDIYRVVEKRIHDMKTMLVENGAYPYLKQAFYDQADHLSMGWTQEREEDDRVIHVLNLAYDISFEHEEQYHSIDLGLVNINDDLNLAYTTPIYFMIESQPRINTEKQTCRFNLSVVQKVWDDEEKTDQLIKIQNPNIKLFASQDGDDPISEALFKMGYVIFPEDEEISENLLPLLKQSPEDTSIVIEVDYKEDIFSAMDLSDIIKKNRNNKNYCPDNAMGQPCMMNFTHAKEYCEKKHAGLPTILQLAEFYNPSGVTIFNNPYRQFKMAVMGQDKHSLQTKVEFYYTLETYPQQSWYDVSLWSSLDVPYTNGYRAYVFNLENGDINAKHKAKKQAVVCRLKRQ